MSDVIRYDSVEQGTEFLVKPDWDSERETATVDSRGVLRDEDGKAYSNAYTVVRRL